jgi:hypothetical protein
VSRSAPTQAAASGRVIVFDTTMRDGEQSPGASMSLEEKLELAKILEEMRVDVIEAGFPIASNGDFESVSRIAEIVTRKHVVCGLARAAIGDIDRCAEALKKARRGRIHTFISTSPVHMKWKLQMEPDAVHDMITVGDPRPQPDRRRGMVGRRRHPHRIRLPAPLRRGGDQGRRHDDQHPRHRGLFLPEEYYGGVPRRDRERAGIPTRRSSRPTATTTWAWPSPTAWPA